MSDTTRRQSSLIWSAMLDHYPTELEARTALEGVGDAPYLGVWLKPAHPRIRVHVFSHQGVVHIENAGWGRIPQEGTP